MLTSTQTVSTSELPIPTTTFDYEDAFGSGNLQEKALGARNDSFRMFQLILNYYLQLSDQYYETYEQCAREFGPKKGKAKFNSWIKSETFGIPKKMLSLARDFSPWFRNLEKSLQNLVCQKAPELTVNILKKLILLPPELIKEVLTSSEKLTLTIINKALANISPPKEKELRFRKKGYAQVITPGHRLSGQIGQLQDKPDEFDNIILVMFPGGPEETLKIGDVKPVSKPATQRGQVDKNYDFVLDEKNQELEEKNRQIEHFQTLVETLTLQKDLAFNENIGLQSEIKSAPLDKTKVESSAKNDEIAKQAETKAQQAENDAIALIQANTESKVREKLQQREQEIEQREQQLQQREREQELREKQQEEFRLQAQRLEAAQAEAKRWQERVQYLEQKVEQKNPGEQEFVLAENTELRKEIKALLERNAELEKANNQKTASDYDNSAEQQTTTNSENLEVLTEDLSAALELFGIPGWGPEGYRARDKRVYTGAMAVKAFLEDQFSGNNQPPEKQGSVKSSVGFAEYSRRISTPV